MIAKAMRDAELKGHGIAVAAFGISMSRSRDRVKEIAFIAKALDVLIPLALKDNQFLMI